MHRMLRFVLLVVVSVFTVASAQSALAAPVAWESVDVVLHSEQYGDMMLISGELPETVPLPAEVEFSVPTGSSLQWIGEILGGPPADDPAVTYTVTTVGDVDVYLVTLTQSRIAQAEITAESVLAFDGANYTSALKWGTARDIPEVRVGVRLPQSATIVQEAAGAIREPGPTGYSYYAKTVTNVKAGDSLDLAFAYSVPAVAASGSGTSAASDSGWLAQVILFMLGLGIAVALIVAVRRKMVMGSPDDVEISNSAETAAKRTPANTSRASTTARESDAAEPTSGLTGVAKRRLFTVGIFATIVLAVFIVGSEASKPQVAGTSISQTFSQGEPCTTTTIFLNVPEGDDPTETSEILFSALETVNGLNTVTYNFDAGNIFVGFCESETTEGQIREALAPTGLVSQGATP